jgi:Protein of unknown function (DUF2855)
VRASDTGAVQAPTPVPFRRRSWRRRLNATSILRCRAAIIAGTFVQPETAVPQTSLDFIVNRRDLRDCRFVETPLAVGDGELLLAIDRFALTANNITYAVAGDSMSYWQFFPAEAGWGRVPVWGYATVVQSNCDGITTGERLYGYLPMSTHLVVRPDRVTESGFVDGASHRAERAAVYNQYQRVRGVAADENAQMLLRPLFMTSFLLDDLLDDNDFFGARAVILSSASSKTSLGLAYLLRKNRSARARIIGLTSPANRSFVDQLGYYDQVIGYDALPTLDASVPSVFIDMAGNGGVLRDVHEHFRDSLRYSCLVGATHWDARSGAGRDTLPGPKPELFFAPSRITKRNKDWGRGGIDQRVGDAWNDFTNDAKRWMKVVEVRGPAEVERIYLELLAGKTTPDVGYVAGLSV